MEVVCLILGPMLASQPCSHAFGVLTPLHLPSFSLKMFFKNILVSIFFSERREYCVHVHTHVHCTLAVLY